MEGATVLTEELGVPMDGCWRGRVKDKECQPRSRSGGKRNVMGWMRERLLVKQQSTAGARPGYAEENRLLVYYRPKADISGAAEFVKGATMGQPV
jgi:hypothetical protein